MVLQREVETPIWGWGAPGEAVAVEIAGRRVETKVAADGKWRVELPARPAGGPFDLTISATNKIVFANVHFGDVWLCAGQSNLAFPLKNSSNGKEETATATYPRIRFLTVPAKSSAVPVDDFDASWQVCSPKTAADFSAVAYHFGRRLHEELDVAIGLIEVAWGGSTCEAWIAPEILAHFPELAPTVDPARIENSRENQKAGRLRNGMLAPLRGFAISGVVWYQGESNASRAWQYRLLFPLLIANWREDWEQGDFPFYFVQLPGFMKTRQNPGESAWAELRESQHRALSLRNVGEVVTIDVGDAADFHPKNKKTVGNRLALLALAKKYGRDVICSGPEFQSMQIVDDKAMLTFKPSKSPLAIADGSAPPFEYATKIQKLKQKTKISPTPELRGFAVAGADQKFYWATATLDGADKIVVSAPEVPRPVAVRYAWADNPDCNLTNAAGLPASPFRTDDWAGVTVDAK